MLTNLVSPMASAIKLPKMAMVAQKFKDHCIAPESIPGLVFQQMDSCFSNKIKPGMSVAITGGSRGISNIHIITKAIVDYVKSRGAHPFLFPAMGSHGGATVQGQLDILKSYRLTEDYLGCPIRASMEVCELGKTENGTTVYLDKHSCQADATILCNRIKVHTDFRGAYESGLVKMAVIGMGKQIGADSAHETGFRNFPTLLPEMGAYIFAHSNIIGGLAILENGLEQTCKLCALEKDSILSEEPKLLVESKENLPQILFDNLDVLIIGRAGKDISGNGIDPNVTGRFTIPELSKSKAQRIGILELTEGTHGNFNGIGLADLITKRLFDQCDISATYPNAFTSTVLSDVKIPFMTASDKECFQVALKTCNVIDKANPRIVYIQDTLHLEHILVSEAMLPEASMNPSITVLEEPSPLPFDENGWMAKDLIAVKDYPYTQGGVFV